MTLRALLTVLWLTMGAHSAAAAIDAFGFNTPAEERQYRDLIDELRCPKCLNTNLSGSDSPIAADLRKEVHRLVETGQSDEQIRSYLVDRYGDFILYRPRLTVWSALLYATPAALAGFGFIVIGIMVRRIRRRAAEVTIDAAEHAQLAQLLARHSEAVVPGAAARRGGTEASSR